MKESFEDKNRINIQKISGFFFCFTKGKREQVVFKRHLKGKTGKTSGY